jgi:hypothetical protein
MRLTSFHTEKRHPHAGFSKEALTRVTAIKKHLRIDKKIVV